MSNVVAFRSYEREEPTDLSHSPGYWDDLDARVRELQREGCACDPFMPMNVSEAISEATAMDWGPIVEAMRLDDRLAVGSLILGVVRAYWAKNALIQARAEVLP